MSISRLQLAAALLEYDNADDDGHDDDDVYDASGQGARPKVSHRDSALFKPFQPRPLEQPGGYRRGESTFSHASQMGGYGVAGVHHGERPYQQHQQSQQRQPPSQPPQQQPQQPFQSAQSQHHRHDQSTDLSRWDVPSHLLSPDLPTPVPPIATGLSPTSPLAQSSPRQELFSLPKREVFHATVSEPVSDGLRNRAEPIHSDVVGGLSNGNSFNSFGAESMGPVGSMVSVSPGPFGQLGQNGQSAQIGTSGSVINRPRRYSQSKTLEETLADELDVLGQAEKVRRMAGYDTEQSQQHHRNPSNPIMVPLPPSPGSTLGRISRPSSALNMGHRRRVSTALADEEEEELEEPNPFALPPPPLALGSRFDPKILSSQRRNSFDSANELALGRTRSRMSGMSIGDRGDRPSSRVSLGHGRPSSRGSMDPGGRMSMGDGGRTSTDEGRSLMGEIPPSNRHSVDSLASHSRNLLGRDTQTFEDIPTAEEYGRPLRPRRYGPAYQIDKRSLVRPNTLVMPTPLCGLPPPKPPPQNIPPGYVLGEKPLPPGSRTSILSMAGPRPGMPLSLSQRTFRSSLMVDGKREEEEYWIGGATEEGEVGLGMGEVVESDWEGPSDRRPGKLYGRSLMDQLEARKATMRGKQRVFSGDSRPAMMARTSTYGGLSQPSPVSPEKSRPISATFPLHTPEPLLSFNENGEVDVNREHQGSSREAVPRDRTSKSKSVFGVDQIWEKELAKLKVIQHKEAREAAERETREALEGKGKGKKDKGKKDKGKKDKGKSKARADEDVHQSLREDISPIDQQSPSSRRSRNHTSMSPVRPVGALPSLSFSPERAQPISLSILTESMPRRKAENVRTGNWSDSDDEGAHRGKNQDKGEGKGKATRKMLDSGSEMSDSDSDVPLSKLAPTAKRGFRQATMGREESDDDDDEDVPLSRLAQKSPIKTSLVSPALQIETDGGFGSGSLGLDLSATMSPAPKSVVTGDRSVANVTRPEVGDDNDDDVPLMLKRAATRPGGIDAEDDLPLGFKHANATRRQGAETAWRASMMTRQYVGHQHMGAYPMNPHPSWYSQMAAGYPGVGGGGGGAGGYGMPMGYPSMPNMMGHPGMEGYPMGTGMGGEVGVYPSTVPPPDASKNIDSWRKEVAIAPATSNATGP